MKTIGIIALLMLIFPIVSNAESATVKDCSSIKNAQKRLACYDEIQNKEVVTDKTEQTEIKPSYDYVKAAVKADRAISVEAGVVYKSGVVKPVARTEFYLLDEDLVEIFKKSNLRAPLSGDNDKQPGYFDTIYPSVILATFSMVHTDYNEYKDENNETREIKIFHEQAMLAMLKHSVQKGTSSFTGKLKFESVKPGIYYIVGISKTARGSAIWNYRVRAENTETSVILDQNNAAYIR